MVVTTKSNAQTVHRYPIRWGAPCSRIPPGDGFPQTLQVRHAERPIVQPVTRAAGFAPDHAAVVGAHRTRESDVSESGQDLEQIHAAAGRGMSGLVKPALTRDPDIAAVREVDAASQTTHHGRQIILGARAERAGAERHAVRRAVHEGYEPLEPSG